MTGTVRREMTIEAQTQITNWLTGDDTCFLLGAGCSVCAGKPMIEELTESVLKGSDKKLEQHFKNLTTGTGRSATVEDLITYLVRYRQVLITLSNKKKHNISVEEIDDWLYKVKNSIVSKIADNWESSECHERFLQRLCEQQSQRPPTDIFSLNYDTLLEASLDKLRIPYIDGFRGANNAWFEPATFEETEIKYRLFRYRLFKLHGSVNWVNDKEHRVRRGHSVKQERASVPVVIYPSEQKSQEIQYGVFETLMDQFRKRLRWSGVNNHLVVLGYSFNDHHINKAIQDAIAYRGNNLTVIAFVGPEKDIVSQKERLTNLSNLCDSRFNAFVGNDTKGDGYFIGESDKTIDQNDINSILQNKLWRFENLTDFIAGEKS